MEFTEAEIIAEKKKQTRYIPLTDYFMLWLLTFGRKFEGDNPVISTILEDSAIWSWHLELIPWGYLKETHRDGVIGMELTDKAMALIRERASDD